PNIDIKQAPATPRRRITALECQPSVDRREQRHVFDGILDVEVLKFGHIEVGRMEMGFHEPRHNGSPERINLARLRRQVHRRASRWSGINDPAVLDYQAAVRNGKSSS